MDATDRPTTWTFTSDELPFYDELYRTGLRLTRSVEETEDLLQETYLKAYRHYDRFEDGTNLRAWLFRILRNSHINSYRRRRTRPQEVDFGKLEEFWAAAPEGEPATDAGVLALDDLDHEVRDALNALPHEYKMAVLMVDLQGFTYQEVADILGVPVGTVMSRLYRGRKGLERSLLSYGTRYNYITEPPEKLRDAKIDVSSYFEHRSVEAEQPRN